MTNKKHFTSILSAICVVLVLAICAVLLVACGPKEEIVEVGPKEEIVEVGTYKELVTAFAGDADIVKVTQDIKVEDTLNVTRTFKLDLNGKKLYNETSIWVNTEEVDKWSIISVRKDGNLTVTGNGTIHALENDCYAFDVIGGGKLVIESGIFIGNISAVYVFEGTAEIKGGEYSIQQLDNTHHDERFTLNLYDKNGTASIVVTGGTFHNFDPANCLAEGPNTNFVAEGYTTQLKAGTTDVYEVIIASQE